MRGEADRQKNEFCNLDYRVGDASAICQRSLNGTTDVKDLIAGKLWVR